MQSFEGPKKTPDQMPQIPDISMKDAGKLHLPAQSEEDVQNRIRRMRIEAQNMVSAPTTTVDYCQVMWELYQEKRSKIASTIQSLERVQTQERSPLASTMYGDSVVLNRAGENVHEAQVIQQKLQESAQAIWSGMAAWGKQQKPDHRFFSEVAGRIAELQKEENARFQVTAQMPNDASVLDVWKKVAREKKILEDFLHHLQSEK